jgi:hypothetical protein
VRRAKNKERRRAAPQNKEERTAALGAAEQRTAALCAAEQRTRNKEQRQIQRVGQLFFVLDSLFFFDDWRTA